MKRGMTGKLEGKVTLAAGGSPASASASASVRRGKRGR
jgi:hypothetical protein